MSALKTIRFQRRFVGKDGAPDKVSVLGHATLTDRGWRFSPAGRVWGSLAWGSRKDHPTLKACLPRWVRYPDGCESETTFDATQVSP